MISLTPDEETFLLQQSEVLALLIKFNHTRGWREVSHDKRMGFLNRKRQIEAVARPAKMREYR